jgi:hypothetical protein
MMVTAPLLGHGARREEATHACTDHDRMAAPLGHGFKPPSN